MLLFAYQTFDALDGLQGRKVGMYTNATTEGNFYFNFYFMILLVLKQFSQLFTVFDHGCDSNVLIMTTVASIYAFDIDRTWHSVILLVSLLFFPLLLQ